MKRIEGMKNYFFTLSPNLASFIRRSASSQESLSVGRLNISSQVISRMLLPVRVFLTAPKSFDSFIVGQFYLMVDVAVAFRVVGRLISTNEFGCSVKLSQSTG